MKKFLIGILGLLLAGTTLAAPLESIAWKVPRYSMTARAMDVRQAMDSFAGAQGIQHNPKHTFHKTHLLMPLL